MSQDTLKKLAKIMPATLWCEAEEQPAAGSETCHARGASPWEVKERCGEPSAIDDVMQQVSQRADDPISQTPVHILVPVQLSMWTYKCELTHFLYALTFQDGTLIDMTMGDHGH